MHQTYGIDLSELPLTKTWRWLSVRIAGLGAADTRLARRYAPPPADHG